MKLTLEQRARRNITRRNNEVRKHYPLVAQHFLTPVTTDSITAEIERLKRIDAGAAYSAERLRAFSLCAAERGLKMRDVVSQHVTPDLLEQLDAKLDRLYGGKGINFTPEYKGAEWAAFWWQAARDYAPAWAQEHCPNKELHGSEHYQREGQCPTCRRPLAITNQQPAMAKPKQGSLF